MVKLDQNTLQNIETIFGNKKILQILNAINQDIIASELQVKGKKQDVNLKGWSTDKKEFTEGNTINELKESGLIVEGANTGVDGKTVRKFALTNEGISILSLAKQLGLISSNAASVTTTTTAAPKPEVKKTVAVVSPKAKPVPVATIKPKTKPKLQSRSKK